MLFFGICLIFYLREGDTGISGEGFSEISLLRQTAFYRNVGIYRKFRRSRTPVVFLHIVHDCAYAALYFCITVPARR